eukprot:TRINITY_DN1715_c0_g1_i3.p1 TRINITY_DN1715_c0_g1~~TRINITY_DN1715_c0_g1_i3.p1  ORF type:complete len:130 (-),score=17.48 TRINITY_DN1715_c0_g1_i3:215-604(-)
MPATGYVLQHLYRATDSNCTDNTHTYGYPFNVTQESGTQSSRYNCEGITTCRDGNCTLSPWGTGCFKNGDYYDIIYCPPSSITIPTTTSDTTPTGSATGSSSSIRPYGMVYSIISVMVVIVMSAFVIVA